MNYKRQLLSAETRRFMARKIATNAENDTSKVEFNSILELLEPELNSVMKEAKEYCDYIQSLNLNLEYCSIPSNIISICEVCNVNMMTFERPEILDKHSATYSCIKCHVRVRITANELVKFESQDYNPLTVQPANVEVYEDPDILVPFGSVRTFRAFCIDCSKTTEHKPHSNRGGGGYLVCTECE